jgi:hypothetical protein
MCDCCGEEFETDCFEEALDILRTENWQTIKNGKRSEEHTSELQSLREM